MQNCQNLQKKKKTRKENNSDSEHIWGGFFFIFVKICSFWKCENPRNDVNNSHKM